MKRIIPILFSLLLCLPALGAAPDSSLAVTSLDRELPGADIQAKARAFVKEQRTRLLPDDPGSQLRVQRVVETPLGRVVQFRQFFDGLPVHGGSLVLSFDGSQHLRLEVNRLRPMQDAPGKDELISADQALEEIRQAFLIHGRLRGEPRLETVWLDGARVHLVTVPAAQPFGDYTFVVAGPRGKVAWVYRRDHSAMGYAYLSNPVRDQEVQEVELPRLSSSEHLSGEFVEVFNCTGSTAGTCSASQQLAAPDADGNYYILPEGDDDPELPDDRFVEVQAYYAINHIYDYFIAIGANPSPLQVGVNYPMPADYGPNAFYSPNEQSFGGPAIMMGQWQTIDLAVDNDVIFHEYGHHVFGEVSSAGMFSMDQYGPVFYGLAFNEATADYFSCSALDDPALGEYFASRLPQYMPEGYLRILDNELTCPDGLYGEGHDDGMVWSGYVWKLREMLGTEVMDPLYLDVIAHFPADIDFPSATAVLLERAALIVDEETLESMQQLAQARGIDTCTRFIALRETPHTGFVHGQNMLEGMPISLDFIPAQLHYYIDLPDGATSLQLDLSSTGDTALLVRVDQPVEHAISLNGLDSTYDFMLEQGGRFDLLAAEAQFESGHRYYFHPVNRETPDAEYKLGAVAECPAGTRAQVADDEWVCAPDCEESHSIGWDGEVWICYCPDGTEEIMWDGELVCAPACPDGEEPALNEESWTCVPSSEGCGCAQGGPGSGLLCLLAGLVLRGLTRRGCRRRG